MQRLVLRLCCFRLLAGTRPQPGLALPTGPTGGVSAPSLQARLQELSQAEALWTGPSSPTQRLLQRVQAAQAALQRAELLARVGDAGSARSVLRGRELQALAYDLGFGAEAYRLLPPQVLFLDRDIACLAC